MRRLPVRMEGAVTFWLHATPVFFNEEVHG